MDTTNIDERLAELDDVDPAEAPDIADDVARDLSELLDGESEEGEER